MSNAVTQLRAAMRAKGYWTVTDIAEKFMVSTSAVYKWIDYDHVDVVRRNRSVFIRYDSVVEYVGERATQILEGK